MKKIAIAIAVATLLVFGAGASGSKAIAGEGWNFDAEVTFNSKYVWRGMNLVDDWVAQPSFTVSKGGFSFNVWGDINLTDQNDMTRQIDELDLTFEYDFTFGNFTIPVGLAHYTFPNTAFSATTELFTGIAYDWIVSPSVTVYWDVDQANGVYVLAGAGYSFEVPGLPKGIGMSVDLSAGIGYATDNHNDYYFGVNEGGWVDWNASLAVPVSFLDGKVTVTPAVTYTSLVDDKLRDTTDKENNTYFGVTVALSF